MFVEARGESLSVQVNVIKPDTVLVNWTVDHLVEQQQLQLQIVYSPVQVSYYIVHPILNPATEFVLLENLQPYTSYQLRIRSSNLTSLYLQTDTVYFSTSGKWERPPVRYSQSSENLTLLPTNRKSKQ